MGKFRLIAIMTCPLTDEGERAAMEKKIKTRFKGIKRGAKVYFRQDMVDDISAPPDEAK